MSGEKITYEDIRQYQHLFTLVPSFVLERFAKRNSNIVSKFKSQITSHLRTLDDVQLEKLDIILNTSIDELQEVMMDAYKRSNVKQYKVLANPEYGEFIKLNLDEIRRLL